jgi:Jumonji helical domain
LLKGKETIIVPSGWIHAVYTGIDTLVFGGNFLHGYAVQMQIKINELEVRSNVMEKFRCPYFNVTYIFALNMYLNTLQSTTEGCTNIISKRELDQIQYLVNFICSEYHNSVRLKLKGRLRSASASYNTVYEEPKFELAVKYVLSEHNCSTLFDFLKKLSFAMADAMELPHRIAIKEIKELREVAASL